MFNKHYLVKIQKSFRKQLNHLTSKVEPETSFSNLQASFTSNNFEQFFRGGSRFFL